METLSLIGDIDENFYQLGLKDRHLAKSVHRNVKQMLSTPWKSINLVIEEAAKLTIKNTLLKKSDYYHHLKSYSDGLGQSLEETAYIILIPEMISCMSKWLPNLSKGSFGCSSFFAKNSKEEIIHGRILDFPLKGSYDLNERAIFYDCNGMPKTLGFGTAGIPYPSITLMTEGGMTIALHQKFTNILNKNGVSIFEIVFELLKNADDKKSVIDFLKNQESITSWGLNFSFKSGDVLSIDLMGDSISIEEHQIHKNEILYFGNRLVDKSINQSDFIPTGINEYNLMREKLVQKKIKPLFLKKKITDADIIKMMATPYEQKLKSQGHYEDYCLDCITPSSLTVLTMNPNGNTAYYIGGEAPKIFNNNLLKIEDAFNCPVVKSTNDKNVVSHQRLDYCQGMNSLILAQKGFDTRNAKEIYHQLQIAIDHLEHFVEKGIAEFYFLVAQYMNESHSKVLTNLLDDFKKLENHLPQHLNDHCILFIYRLERILGNLLTANIENIKTPKLREIQLFETKIPTPIFHFTTKNIIYPRIDILDIIYVHFAVI